MHVMCTSNKREPEAGGRHRLGRRTRVHSWRAPATCRRDAKRRNRSAPCMAALDTRARAAGASRPSPVSSSGQAVLCCARLSYIYIDTYPSTRARTRDAPAGACGGGGAAGQIAGRGSGRQRRRLISSSSPPGRGLASSVWAFGLPDPIGSGNSGFGKFG